jgi:hypothetical protein
VRDEIRRVFGAYAAGLHDARSGGVPGAEAGLSPEVNAIDRPQNH